MRSRSRHQLALAREPALRRAFTLVELVISVALTSILLTGLTSVLLLTTKALPTSDNPVEKALLQTRVMDAIIADLQYAQYITERGARAIAFTVADRNNDGFPERIRYAWSGTNGTALTRQYNGGTAVTVLDDIYQFDLTYDLKTVTEQYAGVPVESDEVLINYRTTVISPNDYANDNKEWIAQYFSPFAVVFPLGDATWRLTRVRFQAKSDGPVDGYVRVQIRPPAADKTPTTTVLEEKTLYESALTTSYAWQTFSFDTVSAVAPTDGLCLVISYGAGGGKQAKIRYDASGGSGRLTTSNAGSSWSYSSSRSLNYQAYGKVVTPGPVQTATRQFVTGVRCALRVGSDSTARVDGAARMLNAPEVLSAVWELDFDRNPTTMDQYGDGVTDWVRHDGQDFNMGSLSGGVWTADSVLDTQPGNDFTSLTTVDLRFRNTSVGGTGATFAINADRTGGVFAPLIANLCLQADGTQLLTVYGKSDGATQVQLLSACGLSSGPVSLRLLIDPTLNTVNVNIDGVDKGTRTYFTFTPPNEDRLAAISTAGSTSEFDYVRVRVGGS